MKEIHLTRGKVALVDEGDFEELNKFKWSCTAQGYAMRILRKAECGGQVLKSGVNRPAIWMHQQIMKTKDTGLIVDHINKDGLDNRRQNLRVCTHSQNHFNQKKRSWRGKRSSEYKGVTWYKAYNKWQVKIRFNGIIKSLGYFVDETEAARAYNSAALLYHGEFASLNIIK